MSGGNDVARGVIYGNGDLWSLDCPLALTFDISFKFLSAFVDISIQY